MKSRIVRLATSAVVATAAVVPTVIVGTTAASHASVASVCDGQDGIVDKTYKVSSTKFTLTHMLVRDIAAGVAYHKSVTLSKVTQLTASVTATSSAKASFSVFKAGVEASVGYSVAAEGQKTSSTSETETYDIAATSSDRKFVFFDGAKVVKGSFSYYSCSRAPGVGTYYSGTFTTFGPFSAGGAALCPASRYSAGSNASIAASVGCS